MLLQHRDQSSRGRSFVADAHPCNAGSCILSCDDLIAIALALTQLGSIDGGDGIDTCC